MLKKSLPILLMLFAINSHRSLCIANSPVTVEPQEAAENINRVLFIFLDDSEYAFSRIAAITREFLNAFLTQAGPIIVSASILNNIRNWQKPNETNPQQLFSKLNSDETSFSEKKNIILSTIFSTPSLQESFQSWIIKEVNQLYLLIPKNYLETINIDEKNVLITTSNNEITETEQLLGLKVNHMRTIPSIDQITSYGPSNRVMLSIFKLFNKETGYYFMQAIWDYTKNRSNIFVTRKDYHNSGNKKIVSWSIYLSGHGMIYTYIASLPLVGFKKFLVFLETKINIKLLYYTTCYAAGTNSNLIYKDSESSIDKTYSYTVITDGIIESETQSSNMIYGEFKNQSLSFVTTPFYNLFSQETIKDLPDYHRLFNYERRTQLSRHYLTEITPQIKYPGLPWFSIIDSAPFVSIGSILAKNRKAPLDIATFFPKKLAPNNTQFIKQQREILGILLYATKLPFEIIINTKNNTGNPPEIISMIPGDIIHHIEKISSTTYALSGLLDSFTKTLSIGTRKTFIIDQMSGADEMITNIVIQLIPKQDAITYWMDKDGYVFRRTSNVFPKKNIVTHASVLDGLSYRNILASIKPVDNYRIFKSTISQAPTSLWQNLGLTLRKSQQFTSSFYKKNIAPAANKLATWFALKKAKQNQPALAK